MGNTARRPRTAYMPVSTVGSSHVAPAKDAEIMQARPLLIAHVSLLVYYAVLIGLLLWGIFSKWNAVDQFRVPLTVSLPGQSVATLIPEIPLFVPTVSVLVLQWIMHLVVLCRWSVYLDDGRRFRHPYRWCIACLQHSLYGMQLCMGYGETNLLVHVWVATLMVFWALWNWWLEPDTENVAMEWRVLWSGLLPLIGLYGMLGTYAINAHLTLPATSRAVTWSFFLVLSLVFDGFVLGSQEQQMQGVISCTAYEVQHLVISICRHTANVAIISTLYMYTV